MADRSISLETDEALVLFELLHRWDEENRELPLEPGELAALGALSAALERVLSEPFDLRYAEILEGARARLSAREGS
ncbi:hypothetical protein ACFUTX_14335 [Microbacterium sp. NPDC057407]|uniref:hypothetical protein n=1 Tax=Microbacterium sp. NPDC057407 TaxID=3346120 RepID=UPI00366BB25D